MKPAWSIFFLIVGVLVISEQAFRMKIFYTQPNPLASEKSSLEPLVEMGPIGFCGDEPCQPMLWSNISPRLHPRLVHFDSNGGWRQSSHWPYRYVSFDGIDDTVQLDHVSMDTASGYTAAVWVRTKDRRLVHGQIFDSRSSSMNSPLRISQRGGSITCEMETPKHGVLDQATIEAKRVKANHWHFVVCSLDRKNRRLDAFIDAKHVASTQANFLVDARSDVLSLGGSRTAAVAEYFRGDIAYFKLLPHSSDESAVRLLFEQSKQVLQLKGSVPYVRKQTKPIRISRAGGQPAMAN